MFLQQRFAFQSDLTPDRVRSRLLEATAPAPASLFERDARPLVGTIGDESFSIIRTSRGRNSFRPVVRGRIRAAGTGSLIEGTMGLHPAVMVAVAILLLIPGGLLVGGVANASGRDPVMLAVAGAIVLFLTVMVLAILWERRQTLACLVDLLEGRPPTGPAWSAPADPGI